jgi:hypothetical protein
MIQRLTTVPNFRSPFPRLTTRPPSPSGSAHDVLDDDQTASQYPKAEEDEIATRHVRLKTRHPEPSTGMNSGPPLDLSDSDAKSSPDLDSSLTDITSQPPSSLSSFKLQTGEPEPVSNVIGTPVLPTHPPTPAPPSPAAAPKTKDPLHRCCSMSTKSHRVYYLQLWRRGCCRAYTRMGHVCVVDHKQSVPC